MKNNVGFAFLQKRGGIKLNESGKEVDWGLKALQPVVQTHTYGGTISFEPLDRNRRAQLEWRGYYASDIMHSKVKAMNKSNEAMINYYGQIVPDLVTALTDHLG